MIAAVLACCGPPYTPIPSLSPSPSPVPTLPRGIFISTNGLDIGQVLGIVLPLIICAIAVLTWRDTRLDRRQREMAAEQSKTLKAAQEAVIQLAAVLNEKLETKDSANLVRVDMSRLRARVDALQEVIAVLDRKIDNLVRRQPR
jgi:hypothetical protein